MEYKQYYLASQLLKDEIQATQYPEAKARKAFLIGQSSERMNDREEAQYWFEKAYDWGYGQPALYHLGLALQRTENYNEALRIFKQLYGQEPNNQSYRREIAAVQQALLRLESAKNDSIEIEPWGFNSPHSDFSPFIQGNVMYFTSDRRASTGDELYQWTGQKFMDIYEWPLGAIGISPEQTELPLNSVDHESGVVFHPNGQELVFTRCSQEEIHYDVYCRLYHSVRIDGRWTSPEPLPFLEPEVNYMHPAFSSDGSSLYFSSDHPDNIGLQDIWQVRYEDRSWGLPRNMGQRINTLGREAFPTLSEDTLFFSSDYRVGMGGFDIFRTYEHPRLGWLPPQPLPYPINSGSDDMSFLITDRNSNGTSGYFVSSRGSSSLGDNIYQFFQHPQEEDTSRIEEESPLALEIRVKGEVYRQVNDPNSGIIERKALSNAKLDIIEGSEIQSELTNFRGAYEMPVQANREYFIVASADGFLNKSTTFSTFGVPEGSEKVYVVELVLPQKVTNREIILRNIYYDFDESNIRSDAALVLDTLTQLLSDNPDIRIQLNSHTDCRGEEEYNQELSQARAQAAVDYLIRNGIGRNRLTAQGFGESRPEIECLCELCTEEEHQANRRTSFTILSDD